MNKEICLIKHFPDNQFAHSGDRNTSITAVDDLLVDKSTRFLLETATRQNKDDILLISSPLKRSIQSCNLVMSKVRSLAPNINIQIREESRITPLRHGRYKPTSSQDLERIEKQALEAFSDQALKNKNMFYRHGDPVIDGQGVALYPNLVNAFENFGENHREFTIRIYSFVLDLLNTSIRDNRNLVAISSHTSPILRFYELASLASRSGEGNLIEPGSLYLDEWREMSNLKDKQEVMQFMEPASFGILNIADLLNYKSRLEQELQFLKKMAYS